MSINEDFESLDKVEKSSYDCSWRPWDSTFKPMLALGSTMQWLSIYESLIKPMLALGSTMQWLSIYESLSSC